jgi:hypothetical protein
MKRLSIYLKRSILKRMFMYPRMVHEEEGVQKPEEVHSGEDFHVPENGA